jgi:restriction system protein
MTPGDLVIYPYKPDSTVNFGRVEGDYYYDQAAPLHRNRRKVAWLRTGVPRAEFSKGARYEMGSAVTLFVVKTHAEEFRAFLDSGTAPEPASTDRGSIPADEAADIAEDEPNAGRIEEYTRDFVIETLVKEIEGVRFEHFIAHLLRARGYRAQVTPPLRGNGSICRGKPAQPEAHETRSERS